MNGEDLLYQSQQRVDILLQLFPVLLAGERYMQEIWILLPDERQCVVFSGLKHLSAYAAEGLSRVIANEYSELIIRRITFGEPLSSPETQASLVCELQQAKNVRETDICWRGGTRFTEHIAPLPDKPLSPVPISAGGRYLLVGGTGGIGLLTARWLLSKGARHLVLLSRQSLPEKHESLCQLRETAQVDQITGSVEDYELLLSLFQDTGSPPLSGIIHCAGTLEESVSSRLQSEQLVHALKPKLLGGWNLLRLAKLFPLDFLVFYSSAATIIAPPGLGNYVACNRVVEGLLPVARHWGLPVSVIGISAVTGTRTENIQSSNLVLQRFLEDFKALSPAQMMLCLDRLMSPPQAMVQLIFPRGSKAQKNATPDEVESGSPSNTTKALDLDGLGQAERYSHFKKQIVTALRKTFQAPDREFSTTTVLMEQGLDSLLAVELRQRLVVLTGLSLPGTVLFDYPSIDRLAEYLETLYQQSHHEQGQIDGVLPEVKPLRGVSPMPEQKPEQEAEEEAVAIIGMGCRLQGGINTPEQFWEALANGRDLVGDIPTSRWDSKQWYSPDPDDKERMICNQGGFLNDVELFDPLFFEIPPKDAPFTDPQCRVFMEVSWQAFEDAGLTFQQLWGSNTGVYLGVYNNDYQRRILARTEQIDAAASLGSEHSTMVGRLAYWLNFTGPAMPVNTACSSSLVAVHMGCRALLSEDLDIALCGGINLMLSPQRHIYFSRLNALSPTGRCRTFSAEADGFVPSEGCGMVVLKRLSDALTDG